MTQNRSSAVMQQRKEPHDSLDYFPTPPWATRALCERLMQIQPLTQLTCWEPACGEGHMARPLGEYFDKVFASDVYNYSDTYPELDYEGDFLTDWDHPPEFMLDETAPDWIITNPPFNAAEEFAWTAMRRAKRGCALLVCTSFLEGQKRYRGLFSRCAPKLVLIFSERVPMFKGRLDRHGSSATSYCWIVWNAQRGLLDKRTWEPPKLDWIEPCRSRLERPSDYPAEQTEKGAAPLLEGLSDE